MEIMSWLHISVLNSNYNKRPIYLMSIQSLLFSECATYTLKKSLKPVQNILPKLGCS